MEEHQYCRLCLSRSAIYHSLLKHNGKEMLFALTGIEINSEISSTDSCAKCWLDLKLAYHIQQTFVEADKRFQDLGMQCPPKIEPVSPLHEPASLLHQPPSPQHEPSDNIESIESFTSLFQVQENPSIKNEVNDDDDDDLRRYPEVIFIQADEVDTIENSTVCPLCGLTFQNNDTFYNHISSHYNEPQHCTDCSLPLPSISAYWHHIETKHPKEMKKPYYCGKCKLSFRYRPFFNMHLLALHPAPIRRSPKPRIKKNHKKLIDDIDDELLNENLSCNQCNKVFYTKSTFRNHVKGHMRRACPICGAKITIYNLTKHVKLHKSGPAVCHLCGITAKNHESLRGHMYYTHSQKRLTCEECGRVFKKLYSYKMHIKKEHTGERTFTCDSCGKRFFTNYELNNHIKSRHLKQRPHICQYCQKGFSSRFAMKTHER